LRFKVNNIFQGNNIWNDFNDTVDTVKKRKEEIANAKKRSNYRTL